MAKIGVKLSTVERVEVAVPTGPIDFKALARDLLQRADTLLPAWFPSGKWAGKEFKAGNLDGDEGNSLSINGRTGVWTDFADGPGNGGHDLISLYAAIHRLDMGEAAMELTDGNPPRGAARNPWEAREIRPTVKLAPAKTRDWKVPAAWRSTNECHHFQHGKPSAKWAYMNERGELIGYVARYDVPGEKKQFCPWTWDGGNWKMKKWPSIQPLYGMELLAARPNDPVLICEGEKAANAARKICGEEYVCITWPGGGNATGDVAWDMLAGRNVLLWPDADKAGLHTAEMIAKALTGIAAQLAVLDVTEFEEKWDAADVLADGWDRARFDKWVAGQFSGGRANVVEIVKPVATAEPAEPEVELEEEHTPPPDEILKIPGMLGKVVEYGLSTAIKPQPIYAVASALCIGSVLMGRMYKTTHENFSPIYVLCIGKSGTGKEHVKTIAEDVLAAARLSPQLIGPSKYTSESGLLSALIKKPTQLHVSDELGIQLDMAKKDNGSHAQGVTKMQMECFGRAHGTLQAIGRSEGGMGAKERKEEDGQFVLKPSLTILAMSTPHTFYEAIGSKSLRDGYLNRFIVMECHAGRELSTLTSRKPVPPEITEWARKTRFGENESRDDAGNLVSKVHDVPHDQENTLTLIEINDGAKAAFRTFEGECLKEQDRLDYLGLAEMWSRANEISMRISMIIAQSCVGETGEAASMLGPNGGYAPTHGTLTITRFHAEWSIKFVRHWTMEMVIAAGKNIAENDFDAAYKDVARIIYTSKSRGYSAKEIRDRSIKFKKISPSQQDAVLRMLVEDGEHGAFRAGGERGPKTLRYAHLSFLEVKLEVK